MRNLISHYVISSSDSNLPALASSTRFMALFVQLGVAISLIKGALTAGGSIPEFGGGRDVFVIVGLASCGVGFVLMLTGHFGRDHAEQMHLVARVCAWQAAVGSVLTFTIGLSDPQSARDGGVMMIGLGLLSPAIFGVVATVLGQRLDIQKRVDERAALISGLVDELSARLSVGDSYADATTAGSPSEGNRWDRTVVMRSTLPVLLTIGLLTWLRAARRQRRSTRSSSSLSRSR